MSRAIRNDIKIEGVCETSHGKRFIVEIQRKRITGDSNRWVYYSIQDIAEQGRAYYSSLQNLGNTERKAALANFYKNLYPVKVITVMDFDTPSSRNELQNHSSDAIVHWGIYERSTKKLQITSFPGLSLFYHDFSTL